MTQATQDSGSGNWKVTVKRENQTERVFNVKHVVFATGLSGTKPNTPKIPGMVSIF